LKFLPPAAALSRAIAKSRTTAPIFKTNDRWLKNPELDQAPAEPRRPDTRVWRELKSPMTSSAYACEFYGEPEAASERAINGWKTRRAAAESGR